MSSGKMSCQQRVRLLLAQSRKCLLLKDVDLYNIVRTFEHLEGRGRARVVTDRMLAVPHRNGSPSIRAISSPGLRMPTDW